METQVLQEGMSGRIMDKKGIMRVKVRKKKVED